MKSFRWLIIGILIPFVIGMCWAGMGRISGQSQEGAEGKKGKKIEVLPSDGIEVTYASVENISKQPHLQYRIANRSNAKVFRVNVEALAHDQSDRVLGGIRLIARVDLRAGASTQGLIAADPIFSSATRVTMKVTPLSWDGVESFEERECALDFCGPGGGCGGLALERCDGGGIDSYNCQQGSPCRCKFMCYPRPPAQ